MKKQILMTAAAAMLAGSFAAGSELPAFPGAEGFGRYATGGRGGEIYHVTTLDDKGPGSLRDAVSKEGRIIVFDVCGVIRLNSELVFKGNTTILGQTAPGEGVQVYGNRVSFSGASNLIVRHMRFRMGVNGPSGKDAAGIANGHDMIFDHLSVLWGRDENFSVNLDNKADARNITIQNSIIGQGLQGHSCGGLIQTDGGVTLYRNLYIENNTRNPKVKGLNQFVNNVVYNWGDGAYIMGDTEGASWAHIENNYFINGPWEGAVKPFTRGSEAFHYYGAGNYHDSDKNGTLDGKLLTIEQMSGLQSDGRASTWVESLDALNSTVIHEVIHGSSSDPSAITSEQDRTIPSPIPAIEGMTSAAEAFDWILENGGPTLPARDDVDRYLIDELASRGTSGTKMGISSELQLPHLGTGVLSGGVKPLDTDGDGIPDAWETANGLDPNDASDAAAIAANGYANIENYANSITEAYPYIKRPLDLRATRQGKTEIELAWDCNMNTEHPYIVEISTGNDYTVAAKTEAGAKGVTLTGLEPETTYNVRLHAEAADGSGIVSDYAELVTETTGDPSSPKPSVLVAPAEGSSLPVEGGIEFKWTNSTKPYFGTISYNLCVGTDKENPEVVATGLEETTYTMEGLTANTTYYWKVTAVNEIGATDSETGTFVTLDGGTLFYADFYHNPQEWFDAYGDIMANTNIINSANTTLSVGGMTIGTGDESIRILAMNGANNSADTSKDYGPATAADAGATDRCIQFYTTVAGGYLTTPEVEGPCNITLWLGNPDKKAKTVKLSTIEGGEVTATVPLELGAKKRVYKFVYSHEAKTPVVFRIDNNAMKFNINDILIERPSTQSGIAAAEVASSDVRIAVEGTAVTVSGVTEATRVVVSDLAGRVIATAKGEHTFALGHGFYIVAVEGGQSFKVVL